jgi:glycosyltransferase involved in cell wall biosynthesis
MSLDTLGVPSRPDGLPTVTAMICAYNYEQFVGRAIESALAQDYPPELLEILVIEDGSTDSTPAIVDEYGQRYPGRIRIVHHANMGYIPSTNVGLAESRGELIALLDADDAWRPEKTRRQVELFQADPTLGLVFCDMAVVDADDAVLQPSKLAEYGPISENRFAALMYENFATTSSIMVRASLRDAFCPIRLDVPGDWWIARAVALRAGLDYVPESLALYRMHGSNMSVGGTKAIVVENKRAIAHQLWGLRHLPLDRLNAQEILHAWSGVERHAQFGVQAGGSFFFDSMDRHPGDRSRPCWHRLTRPPAMATRWARRDSRSRRSRGIPSAWRPARACTRASRVPLPRLSCPIRSRAPGLTGCWSMRASCSTATT